MARLIEIMKTTGEPGFIVSGIHMNDGSLKSYFAFNKIKILALNEIFQQIIKEKQVNKQTGVNDGNTSINYGRIRIGQVNFNAQV